MIRKADSLAADKACGSPPPKPAAMVQVEQLDAQANTLTEQIRELEEKSAVDRGEGERPERASVPHGSRARSRRICRR